jgi:hypothetical protein
VRTWVIALGLGFGLLACTPSYHDATVRFPDGRAESPLEAIAERADAACKPGVDRVNVVLERPKVRARIPCDEIARTEGYAMTAALVYQARHVNDALTSAGRYTALQQVYGRHISGEFDELLWGFASTQQPSLTCARTGHPNEVRQDINIVKDETPVQWTLVEGVRVAAECPDRLADLYDSVAKAGYPDAAREAREQMAKIAKQAGVSLPRSATEPA